MHFLDFIIENNYRTFINTFQQQLLTKKQKNTQPTIKSKHQSICKMNKHQGFVSTAHTYLSTNFNSYQNYKCQTCHLQFQSPMQLQNHIKKFCTNSGFDTLAGLNVRLRNPNYGMAKKQSKRKINDSLTNALEEIQRNKAFVPAEKQLRNDMLVYQRHEQDVKYARPYLHALRNDNIDSSQARRSRSLYQNAANIEQNNNQGQNLLKYKPQQSRSNAYSITSNHVRKFKQSNAYISPPTVLPIMRQNAKQFSLLQRSDMSIKRMSQQQKRQYVVRKLLQLEQIEEGYKKNGGKNDQFIQNTKKMRNFYENLMEDVNNQKDSKFGNIRESNGNRTRVSTPISKLEQHSGQGNLLESLVRLQDGKDSIVKSKISIIHQKNLAKRQDQVRKRFRTQAQQHQQKKNQPDYDILDQQMFRKINSLPKENQIIVIPIQQPSPSSYNLPNQQNNQMALKYLQSLTALKDEQNKTFLSMMQKQNEQMKKMYQKQMKSKEKIVKQNSDQVKKLQKKYQKLMDKMERQHQRGRHENLAQDNVGMNQLPHNNFRISNKKRAKTEYSSFQQEQNKEYRQNHSDIQNVRQLSLQSHGYYTLQSVQWTQQEKILMQMQKQQRDELQLFAHLPYELQQIKLPSLKQLGDKRFKMEKQVIKQKLQKLHLSEEMKHFELQRKLLTQQLQNQNKKITIHKLMKKKIQGMVKQEFYQREQEQTDNDQEENYGGKGQQFGGEPFGDLKKISKRNSHNATPVSQV